MYQDMPDTQTSLGCLRFGEARLTRFMKCEHDRRECCAALPKRSGQRPESWLAPFARWLCADPAGFTIVDLMTFAPPTRCCTPNPPDVFTIRHVDDFAAAMRQVYDAELSSCRIRYVAGGGES